MRRKIHKCLSFLLAAVLLASLAAPAALAAEGGDTVFVRTAEDLVQLAENCTLDSWSQGRIVRLQADIDLSGTDFTPIPTFGGTFEGQGHTISGLSITGSGNVRGLFRYIQPSGVVRDLSVEGRVDPSDRKNTLGGIAGSNRGLLAGCTFHGTVRGADSIGGLVGINESSGQIVNCTFSGAAADNQQIVFSDRRLIDRTDIGCFNSQMIQPLDKRLQHKQHTADTDYKHGFSFTYRCGKC